MVPQGELDSISPDKINPNPENPRLIFRQNEMDDLLESIKNTGIQVPLTVYRNKENKVILLDGERRWRCAKKLNLAKVPVIIHPEPTKLENVLMMFHIHNVRVEWDPLVIAIKLKEIMATLRKEGKETGNKELAVLTGISVSRIRRYLDLLNLPSKYGELLFTELEKPKHEQKISVDLIIEIQKSFKTIEKYVPEALQETNEEKYIDSMLDKYKSDTVKSVVKYRDISKIARAERAGTNRKVAIKAIRHLISTPKATIEDTYKESVKTAYEDRSLIQKCESLVERLEQVQSKQLTPEFKSALQKLRSSIDKTLGD
jgi:ParB/RepB/Spo0J family partition protein